MGLVDRVNIGERKNIIINALGDNEGSKSFCWHIGDGRGKLTT
jgi:hypothetical protein